MHLKFRKQEKDYSCFSQCSLKVVVVVCVLLVNIATVTNTMEQS